MKVDDGFDKKGQRILVEVNRTLSNDTFQSPNDRPARVADRHNAQPSPQVFRMKRILKGSPQQIERRALLKGVLTAITGAMTAKTVEGCGNPTDTECEVVIMRSHKGDVTSVAFSPDGKYLASGSEDDTVKLWNLQEDTVHKTMELDDEVNEVSFSPNGKLLASASRDDKKLWNVSDGTPVEFLGNGMIPGPFAFQGAEFKSVAFSPDGSSVAFGRIAGIELWSLPDGIYINSVLAMGLEVVNSLAFIQNETLLASGSNDETVLLWSLPEGTLVKTLEGHSDAVNSVAISLDGHHLASGSRDNTIKLWNLPEGTLVNTLKGHSDAVNSVAISPDGKLVASASADETIKLWNLAEGILVKTLEGHSDAVNSVAISPDGKTLASGSSDHTIKLWSLPKGSLQTSLKDPSCEETSEQLCEEPNPDVAACSCNVVCSCDTICTCDSQGGGCSRTYWYPN